MIPAYLAHYWEPTQEQGDFHRTFALALCWSHYSDCKDQSRKDEYVVSFAVIWKPASFAGIPFALAADEFSNPDEKESTLLIVHLHCQSRLFPDIYYDRYYSHFTMMHVSGEHYNVGHPQKYVGGLLHNAYEAGEESHSPKAKLPPPFVDNVVYLFPVDSCVWPYRDWTTDHEDRPALEEHFIWLSEETMPFCTDPGQLHVPPDFTLGLADVSDWSVWDGEPPWILDPKECPKPVRPDPGSASPGSAGPGAENGSQNRKNRKKHRCRPRSELKVTNRGEGRDSPVWSQGGPSSSSESSASGVDSGFSSTQKQQGVNTTGATVLQGDRTPLLSPATVKKLDTGDYDNDPLSDHLDYKPSDDDQEMAIVEERPGTIVGDGETSSKETGRGKKDTECNLGNPVDAQDPVLPSTSAQQPGPTRPGTGALASASAVEMRALSLSALALTMVQIQEATATGDDNDDTDEEKARLDAYKGVMWGLYAASHTLSEGYQWACLEVQGLVNQSLNLSTEKDCMFMAETSTAFCRWVKAVQPVIDCLGKSVAEQSRLLEDARKVGMENHKGDPGPLSPGG